MRSALIITGLDLALLALMGGEKDLLGGEAETGIVKMAATEKDAKMLHGQIYDARSIVRVVETVMIPR